MTKEWTMADAAAKVRAERQWWLGLPCAATKIAADAEGEAV
jgi:hypothetical protein